MNRFLLISITLATAVLTGCDGDRKAAQARLEKARAMYEKGEFFAAKNEIDSLRTFYPKEVGVLKEGLTLMRKVEISEAERNIAFCDSLLPIKQAELETLKKGFVFEKDSLYEEIGNYIWKQQTIERNVQRCYVRCGVSEEGEMYLASVYYGGRPIEHTDKGGHCVDAVKFLYDNAKERIKVEYTGGKPYIIYMAEADKQAVVNTFNLATVLSDIHNMTTLKAKSEKKIAYLRGKLDGDGQANAPEP